MRLLLALLAALLLAGCWIGDDFYTAADLRQPIPPGTYRLSGPPDGPGLPLTLRIWNGEDGYTHSVFEERPEDVGRVGFAPLDAEGRMFAAWAVREEGRPREPQAYVLFARKGNGSFAVLTPRCDGRGGYPAGAEVRTIPGACRFSTRPALEAALRGLAPRLGEATTLTRIDAP